MFNVVLGVLCECTSDILLRITEVVLTLYIMSLFTDAVYVVFLGGFAVRGYGSQSR